jgi:hypothetical protein
MNVTVNDKYNTLKPIYIVSQENGEENDNCGTTVVVGEH